MDLKISDLKIGAQLILGKYGVRNSNPFPIMWLKCTPNSEFYNAISGRLSAF